MSPQTMAELDSIRDETTTSHTGAPAVPEVLPLREVLKQIRRDSHAAPAQYLDETEVTHGGE